MTYDSTKPIVILETESYRCVLRATAGSWPEGVVDVESRHQNAMGEPTWLNKCCVSLRRSGARATDEIEVLQEILAQRVKELGIPLSQR